MSNDHTHNDARPLPAIPGYRLLRVIGEGGMSIVYLAVQDTVGREVAIKIMRPDALADEVSRRRFENEVRTIGRLDHPHIVGIFHIGRTADELPYYVMPHLAHGHLGQRDFRGREADVRGTLQALLSALSYAHARGVIHRDVKAENVLFDEAERPLLADFGIALRRGYGSRVTSAGLAVGSTAYMAPEQARGEEVDPRADLYSVGVLAWEMLTGALPFQAGDALSMAVMHAQDPVPRLPPELRHWQRFMDRAMAKYPLKRFHDAQDMLQALQRIPAAGRRHGVGAALQRAARGLSGLPRRIPRMSWVLAALALATLAGLWLRPSPGPQADGFFRAQPAAERTMPDPAGTPGGAGATLAEAAPESAAGALIADAERQLRARRLTQPEGDNAYESLFAAAAADPQHLQLPGAAAALVAALGDEGVRRIRQGDTAAAADFLQRAARVAALGADPAAAELAAVHRRTAAAITERIDHAAGRFERSAAQGLLDLARTAALGDAALAALSRRVRAIPAVGQPIPGEPARMTVVRAGDGAFALTRRAISREEYRRFAEATGQPAALCRERASVMRMLSPRDWTSPGYEQADGDAVVCVSWDDASAYAQWLGRGSGVRYRLPTASEARELALEAGATPVAEWLLDCTGDCSQRAVGGSSWRREAARPRDASRGYDDIGFRLVREP